MGVGLILGAFEETSPPVSVLNQFGFQWRLDDGDEDEATDVKPENESIVTEQGLTSKRRLRVGMQNQGSTFSGQVRLQIQRKEG
jgi:hypothetical protein